MTDELHTPRFLLRRITKEDYPFLLELYSDPSVMEYITCGTCSAETTEKFLQEFLDHWEKHGFGMYVGISKKTGDKLGYIGFRVLPQLEGIEFAGFVLKKFWGQRLPDEAGKVVLEHGFKDLGFDLIYSVAHPSNLPSLKCIEKFGMRPLQAKDGDYHGGFTAYFEITKDEFKKL